MRSPSAKDITTGSSSVTWIGSVLSGSVVKAEKEADIDLFFQGVWARKRVPASSWRRWICGRRFRKLGHEKTHRMHASSMTSFHIMRHLSKALDEVRAAVSTNASAARTGVTSRASDIPCSRDARNLSLNGRRALKKTARGQPASEHRLPPQGKPSASSGITEPSAVPAPSLNDGKTA